MKKGKRPICNLLTIIICLLIIGKDTYNDSLDEQRGRYARIKKALNNQQMNIVQILMPTLKNYPLYPYLRYYQISKDLKNQTGITVSCFIQKNPTFPSIATLKSKFINELARRKDWKGLIIFSPEKPDTIEAQCNYYYAKWIIGQNKEAWKGAKELWLTSKNQPNSCDQLFSVWRSFGNQDPMIYLERICLAMKAKNIHLANMLAKNIPLAYQAISSAIIQLVKNPYTILTFARTTSKTNFSRQMVAVALANIAQENVERARQMIPLLVHIQKLNNIQTQKLRDIVAWQLMNNNITAKQVRWRDNTVMKSNSTSLIERRVRIALNNGDYHNLNIWLMRLPKNAKKKDVWRYWKADVLLKQGKKKQAKNILYTLMQQRGFYPMIAAQRLGKAYELKINKTSTYINPALIKGPEMARVYELIHWNLDNKVRKEWAALVNNHNENEKAQLARYAFNNRWWDLSVQATITGKLWDHLEERFPLAYHDLFHRYTNKKNITQSYAMAIARQESAWNPKVRSSVGATGLMQIMPNTAVYTVKMFNISGYSNVSQLWNPEINISIGTSYLEYVFNQFNNNRIFTSAAYNAGPERVRVWRENSAGRIDAVAFVESIPYSETRSYVKNVLAYDAYHRYFMGKEKTLLSNSEWHQLY